MTLNYKLFTFALALNLSSSIFSAQVAPKESIDQINKRIECQKAQSDFFAAVTQGNWEAVRKLVASGLVNINSRDSYGYTAVQLAGFKGIQSRANLRKYTKIIETLRQAGAV